jgi:hypothetical protein
MDNVPSIPVHNNGKYMLPTSPVPPSVSIEGEMLRNIAGLNFLDHDITDVHKLSELDKEKYLRARIVPGTGEILLETQEWEMRLDKACILNLLEILHFRKSLEINACVKVLLICVHGGTLWIDPPILIDIALIPCIT